MGCFASARHRHPSVKATKASEEETDASRSDLKHADVLVLSLPHRTPVLASLQGSLTALCASAGFRLTDSGDGFRILVVLCDSEALANQDASSFLVPQEVFQAEASWRPVITVVAKGAATSEFLQTWHTACPILFRRTTVVDAESETVESALSALVQDGLEEAGQLAETSSPSGRWGSGNALPSSRLAAARIDLEDPAHVRQTAPRSELDSGAVVVLTGLSASPEMNGRLASLGNFDAQKGRYHAHLVGEERVVAVAPDKLELVGPVLLCGIQSRPELNGLGAAVRRCRLESGRIEVEVDGLGETIAVRPDHVQLEVLQRAGPSAQVFQDTEHSPPGSPHGSPPRSPNDSPTGSPRSSAGSPRRSAPSDSPGKARSPRGPKKKSRRKARNSAPREGINPSESLSIDQALLILEECPDNVQKGEDMWTNVELIEKPEGGATVAYLRRLQQTLNGQPNHRMLKPRRGILKGSRPEIPDGRHAKRRSGLKRANSARFASAAEEVQRGAALKKLKVYLQDEAVALKAKLPIIERVLALGNIPAANGVVAAALTLLVGIDGSGGPLVEGWAGGPAGRGGELLISALRQFQDSEVVQRAGLGAMSGVASAFPACSAVVAAPIACKALQGYPRSMPIRRSGCICLARLLAAETASTLSLKKGGHAAEDSQLAAQAGDDSEMWMTKGAVRHAVLRTGVVQVLLHNIHSRKPDLVTVQSALETLAELSTSTRGRDDILREDGAAIVLLKMRRHHKVHGVQRAGCAVIRQLAAGSRATQEMLVRHGAIRAASAALRRSALSPAAAAEALGLLSNLSAKVPEHRRQVVERPQLITHVMDATRYAAAEAGAGPDALLASSEHSPSAELLPQEAGTEAERKAAASACLAGLAVLHNLTLSEAHREILMQQGAVGVATLCSSSRLPAELRETAQRLQAALCTDGDGTKGGGTGAFSGLFAVRGGPGVSTAPRSVHAVSKHQRRRAQQITQEVLGHKAAGGHSSSKPAEPKRSPGSSSARRHRRAPEDERSNDTLPKPPLEGYGRRGEGGWRIHEENADWLWNDLKGFYFHCATDMLFRRFGDGTILEVSAAPPPRHALLSMVACNSQALQSAIFAVWRDFARERGERGWQSEGSASGASSSESDVGASFEAESSASSTSSDESESTSKSKETRKLGLDDAVKSEISAGGRRVGSAAAEIFRNIEDFVPPEEGRRLSDALAGRHFGAPLSPEL